MEVVRFNQEDLLLADRGYPSGKAPPSVNYKEL